MADALLLHSEFPKMEFRGDPTRTLTKNSDRLPIAWSPVEQRA